MATDCRICGWPKMDYYHKGALDCINEYRNYVQDLLSQLPQGKLVMATPIERDTTIQLWINGEITFEGLNRLITALGFMKQACIKAPANDSVEPLNVESEQPS